MRSLPVVRGYPVPWFVGWINGQPEFRAADPVRWRRAVRQKLCWVCGDKLGRHVTFVAGPMCGINRTSSEPPCHRECAQWSARNCPFLARPHAKRREDDTTAALEPAPGIALARNPGVTLLWTTRGYELFGDGRGGVLIAMGEPEAIEWYAEGKPARHEAVLASIRSGLPSLEAVAATEAGGLEALRELTERFLALIERLAGKGLASGI
jgi:hypothetical protein